MYSIPKFYDLAYRFYFNLPQGFLAFLDGLVSAFSVGYYKDKIVAYRLTERQAWAKRKATGVAYFMIDWRNNEMNI